MSAGGAWASSREPARHPYGAIFSIALQISVIKILSLATFILEYPQTLCKTAQEISVAIYHLVNWLHQTGGGNLFPREIWSHKNPSDSRHCNELCVALLPPTEAGDLAQLYCSLPLIKRIFHRGKLKCRKRGERHVVPPQLAALRGEFGGQVPYQEPGERNSFQVSQKQSCKMTCALEREASTFPELLFALLQTLSRLQIWGTIFF